MKLTIRKILAAGAIFLIPTWGLIFWLSYSDSSYQLFIPQLPQSIETQPQKVDEFPGAGPWKQDLFMGTGDLNSFDGKSFLVRGAATPSAILKDNEIVVYFNYYPSNRRQSFGIINWIKSTDLGLNWSEPSPITIENMPDFSISPFSPKVLVLPNGKIKLYFLAKKTGEDRSKLFAAISDDGAKFYFDPDTVFEIEDEYLIAIALDLLGDKVHLFGYTAEGAGVNISYHAVSYDGKVFTRLADIKIEDSFYSERSSAYGQNSLTKDGNQLVLLGASPRGLWSSTSGDGNNWSSPRYLSFNAQNPSVLKTGNSYRIFYTDIASAN